MILADWIAIAVVAGCLLLGALIGFSGGLKFFTSGIFGIIIGVIVCAFVGTIFLEVDFIKEFIAKFPWEWLGIVVYYIILFIAVQILRIIIVMLLRTVFGIDNVIMKVINRTLGAVFFTAMGALICLFAFRIIGWVGGETELNLLNSLTGSVFKIDALYEWINDLVEIPEIPQALAAIL